ncbi:hypothetical protein ACHAXS_008613, partial [Conticribra weissflogii]
LSDSNPGLEFDLAANQTISLSNEAASTDIPDFISKAIMAENSGTRAPTRRRTREANASGTPAEALCHFPKEDETSSPDMLLQNCHWIGECRRQFPWQYFAFPQCQHKKEAGLENRRILFLETRKATMRN